MKIISSFMNDLRLEKGAYHSITFESTEMLSKFRSLFNDYFSNKKQSICTYIKVLDNKENVLNYRDFYFITFDCNVINLKEDKNSTKTIQELLYFYLENNSDILQEFLMFNEQIDRFLSKIEIRTDDLLIDFQSTNKTITNFIKSLDISIEYNENGYVPNYVMREFLIKAMLNMNVFEKEVILLLSYPETDVGYMEIERVIRFLKELKITTIVVTSQYEFLSAASEENMFLVNRNGVLYDIIGLQKEIQAFELVNNDGNIVKELAYRDFKQDYLLLNKDIKRFLLSDRM